MKRLALALLVALSFASSLAAQDMILTGVVTTREDGLPLPGATVTIDSLRLSATTDASGRFSLSLPAATATDKTLDVRRSRRFYGILVRRRCGLRRARVPLAVVGTEELGPAANGVATVELTTHLHRQIGRASCRERVYLRV